jgi:D-serine deaminase-like pyridoxal phosphate-dependent protein
MPRDRGAPHDDYFRGLEGVLKREGAGHPTIVVDRDRLARNCARVMRELPHGRALRIVVKSLPALGLVREVMRHTGSKRLMTFHQPFMNALATAEPECDLLLGKPMPVNAAARFYRDLDRRGGFAPERQVQWLIDTPSRLAQYLDLAETLGERLRINVEIDVGLHRGGLARPGELDPFLAMIRANPERLELAGLMGYDAHVGKTPLETTRRALARANGAYRGFVEHLRSHHRDLWSEALTLNGAGSPTLLLHGADTPLNELSAGSCFVKPSDFDLPSLGELEPAAFIAAPVLKVLDGLTLPGPLPLGRLLSRLDPSFGRSIFIYGGKWMAKPVSPRGLRENPFFGSSSNQMMLNGSAAQAIAVDDWVFFRPTQSEAVLLQLGELFAVGADGLERWPPLTA